MKNNKKIVNALIYVLITLIVGVLGVSVFYSTKQKTQTVISPVRQSDDGVILTFNVYQGTDEVEKILDVLSEYNVKATFFLGGCWVVKNQSTVKKISERGHVIGSHGYYHYDHSKLNYKQNYDEIKKSLTVIENETNTKVTLFAPPSGAYNDNCLSACEDLGLSVIMWSKDTIDWRDQDVDLIIERATDDIDESDIILMHPTTATVLALPKIIENIISKNIKIRR